MGKCATCSKNICLLNLDVCRGLQPVCRQFAARHAFFLRSFYKHLLPWIFCRQGFSRFIFTHRLIFRKPFCSNESLKSFCSILKFPFPYQVVPFNNFCSLNGVSLCFLNTTFLFFVQHFCFYSPVYDFIWNLFSVA